MRLRFKALFWSGLAIFFVVSSIASWGLFELRSVMSIRRAANNMQMTLHSMLESLQEADVVFLLAKSDSQESEVKKVVDLVNRAHQKAMALTRMDVPNEEIRKEIAELEVLINSKVKTEDDYNVSGDMFAEPVVKKTTTMRDNLVLTQVVREKINKVDHLLNEYLSRHLVYVDEYFTINLYTITFGVILSFGLFMLFARLVSREIDRRTQLEGELRQAQQAAIAASALKSQFLATVSHEVRTPLNGIIGMSELMRDKAQGELKKYSGVIYDSGRSLLRIVNDILDFSRMEANRFELELQEVRLSDVFEMASDLFGTRANEKKLPILVTFETEFGDRFAADGARISQVLHNLLGNAVKFTSSGFIVLRGEILDQDEDEFKMRFSVEDTGTGIASGKRQIIFEPFRQAQTEHQLEGTGLGLSISKRLVELMGGTIDFTSEEGKGSKFFFDLPLRRMQASPPEPVVLKEIRALDLRPEVERVLEDYARQMGMNFHRGLTADLGESLLCGSLAAVRLLSPALQKVAIVIDFPTSHAPYAWRFLSLPLTPDRFKRVMLASSVPDVRGETPSPSQALMARGSGLILLVEDNLTNQILAQLQLEQLGYRVDLVSNGEECLKAIRRLNYDLILMDCRMPILDGFATTRQIRETERQRQTVRLPIIAITANALDGDRERCLNAGMDDYVTKPFELEKLHLLIQKWIASEKTQIDWRVVSDLSNRTNPQVVKKLLDSFQKTLGEALTMIESATSKNNFAEVAHQVHPLKSSAAALGAVSLAHLCTQIERDIETLGGVDVLKCDELAQVGRCVLEELASQTRYS